MSAARTIALVTGICFLVTFLASIPPAFVLYAPVLNDPTYIVGGGAGSDTGVRWGAFLEIILAIANIGTAVTLYPILRRQSEILALGYAASRIAESVIIAVGIISLLAVVTLRQELAGAAGADQATLITVGRALVAVHGWTFLLGPGYLAGIGNGMILGYLMFRSRLIPRNLAVLGLIGGPLAFVSATATLFGLFDQVSVWAAIAILPEFLWELSLGLWLIVKGFTPSVSAAAPFRLDRAAEAV